MKNSNYYINRELSFLKFNKRVLEEAGDDTVPVFERFKFISIFHSNLDEFYMIRVGSLYEKSLLKDEGLRDCRTGWTPERQLKEIFQATKHLYKESGALFSHVSGLLKERGITLCKFNDLDLNDKKWLKNYFRHEIVPLLSPQIMDTKHPLPHLANKQIYIILELNYKKKNSYGVISQNRHVSRIVELPSGKGRGLRYMLSEEIICNYAKELFKRHKVLSIFPVRVTRNADINAEDSLYEYEGLDDAEFRNYMSEILKKRGKLAPVRLELSGGNKSRMPAVKKYLCGKLNISEDQAFSLNTPLDMSFVFGIQNKMDLTLNGLTYAKIISRLPDKVSNGKSVLKLVENKQDIFLSHPKHSVKPYLKLLEESIGDPDVIGVKIALYRLSENSQIIDYLCRLADAGKQVTAVVELNARFDEENNINWSKRLEESGCNVIYGVEGYKVHSKITLITKKRGKSIIYIAHLATGNYNEKTAKLYTDVGIITSNKKIGVDALTFFNSVTTSSSTDEYSCLLVAPLQFKSKIIEFIGEETKKGSGGRIRLKLNSLEDREIIEALVLASQGGVRVDLIVRSICCLRPGVAGKTENIRVTNIVGRFLEHSRIFIFGDGRKSRIYISSADLMTRNTTRRFEIAAPIFDRNIKKELADMFDLYSRDNVKFRELKPNGNYEKVPGVFKEQINAQEILFER
ncbi:MAG: polyphosphate kinase 1 [Acidobacteriota bacterium]|nr:polyphosphate kinase 1 [Acidobacteriota bacterium]